MDPHEYGFLDVTVYGFRPHVEVLAVLSLHPVLVRDKKMISAGRREMKQRTHASVDRTVMDVVPLLRGMRRVESLSLSIRDPLEDIHIVVSPSANFAEGRLDDILGSVKFE